MSRDHSANFKMETKTIQTPAEPATAMVVGSGPWLGSVVRPSTRGQLRDHLKAGQACEVPDCGIEMTKIMLIWWLDFKDFTVQPSQNEGCVLFLPNPRADTRHPAFEK